ncbi:MAG: ABC transporter permease [Dongiaceae bacterium]
MTRSPSTLALKWTGLGLAFVIAGLGLIFGFYQGLPAQQVILYTAATFALVAWVWRSYAARWSDPAGTISPVGTMTGEDGARPAAWRVFVRKNRPVIAGLVILLVVFGICSITITGFFSVLNIISLAVLIGLLIFSAFMSKFVVENRSAFIGLTVLVGLFVVGSLKVEGFIYPGNIKSMLLFASFLGLACVGQTMVALLGGLDLSIPFVIGSANVGLLYLIGLGMPAWFAVLVIIAAGVLIGLLNGYLSFRLQGQALILTLGIGFATSGLTQILTSVGSRFAGNVFGTVPGWLTNLAAMNGKTFGLDVPPVIIIWFAVAVLLIVGMKNTVYGRYLYALGGNRVSAARLSISERRYWVGAYAISGGVSALTGALLLGWSGGGFIGVGQPYLFMTLAAVVIGGTSLLGGYGGYGFTVIGVLVLQVLTSFLVGIGLNYQWQQFIFGLLILPMVALYARSPHIRTQV